MNKGVTPSGSGHSDEPASGLAAIAGSVPNADEPYENTLSLEELRRAVRAAWDKIRAIECDIADLPEVPAYSTMILLSRRGYPLFWGIGKQYQRDLPYGAIPWKCEAEIGAGRWKVIREALLAAQGIDTRSAETACPAPSEG